MSKFTSDGLTQSGTGCFVAIQPASTDCIPRCRRITFGHRAFLCCGPDGLELTTDWVSWSVCRFWCFWVHS